MEKFRQILLDKGIKPTYHRMLIMDYLDKNPTHPTADMIYSALFKKMPTLSRTTIYNTIDVLRKNKLINAIAITESELRYEYQQPPHHHFLCEKCGNIFDVHVKCNLPQSKELDGGHKIKKVEGYIYGICIDCLNKEEKAKNEK